MKILYLNTGSCNGCDIEILVALLKLEEERGQELPVDTSIRESHYDVAIITGPVTAQSLCRIVRQVVKVGKLHISKAILVGSCACGGGIWYDTYATLGGFDNFLKLAETEGIPISVDHVIYVTGCPARPEDIYSAVKSALNI